MNKTLDRNDLVKKMNLEGVPADVQDQIIAQLGENVLKSVTFEIVSLLSDEDSATFDELTKGTDQEKMEKFLTEKVPTLEQIIKEKTDTQIESVRKAMSVAA